MQGNQRRIVGVLFKQKINLQPAKVFHANDSIMLPTTERLAVILCLIAAPTSISAWSVPKTNSHQTRTSNNRRALLQTIATTSLVILPSIATAAPSQEKDKQNLIAGYNRLNYLLDHWEAETTICKTGQETTFGDVCERTPVKVQEYLGYKSMNDPLFKADATMLRLKNLVPSDREEEFYEAIDRYTQNAEEANGMAFVSSWGEANPGGGKDRVQLFIERSKKNVIESRDGLKTVMDILGLKP
jgi:hypothetical protein